MFTYHLMFNPMLNDSIELNNKTCDFEHVQFIAHDITCED